MGYSKTPRRGLETPESGNAPSICGDFQKLADLLDNDAETGNVAKHSELPAAGTRGRIWQVTEDAVLANNGVFWDTGSAWFKVSYGNGDWEALTINTTKVEDLGAVQSVRSRTEANGTVVRLRGALTVKSGKEVKAGEELATLPVACHPPGIIAIDTQASGVLVGLEISTGGVITLASPTSIASLHTVTLDTKTYNLT